MAAGNRQKTCATFFAAVFVASIVFLWQESAACSQSPQSIHPTPAGTDPNSLTVFRPVQGAEREQVPGGLMMVAAYGVVWLLLFAYVVHIGRLQARTQRDLERLEQAFSGSSRLDEHARNKK
jgi:CcmD family protein